MPDTENTGPKACARFTYHGTNLDTLDRFITSSRPENGVLSVLRGIGQSILNTERIRVTAKGVFSPNKQIDQDREVSISFPGNGKAVLSSPKDSPGSIRDLISLPDDRITRNHPGQEEGYFALDEVDEHTFPNNSLEAIFLHRGSFSRRGSHILCVTNNKHATFFSEEDVVSEILPSFTIYVDKLRTETVTALSAYLIEQSPTSRIYVASNGKTALVHGDVWRRTEYDGIGAGLYAWDQRIAEQSSVTAPGWYIEGVRSAAQDLGEKLSLPESFIEDSWKFGVSKYQQIVAYEQQGNMTDNLLLASLAGLYVIEESTRVVDQAAKSQDLSALYAISFAANLLANFEGNLRNFHELCSAQVALAIAEIHNTDAEYVTDCLRVLYKKTDYSISLN